MANRTEEKATRNDKVAQSTQEIENQNLTTERNKPKWIPITIGVILAILLILAIILAARSCGGGEGDPISSVTTVAPEVTTSPEVTVAPEVTTAPEVTVAPEVTTAPEATVAPEVTTAPEATVAPEVTTAPEATVAPEVTTEPEATVAPEVQIVVDDFVKSSTNLLEARNIDSKLLEKLNKDSLLAGYVDKNSNELKELVAKYGEFAVQKALANMITLVPEIKVIQYANFKGMEYKFSSQDAYYEFRDEMSDIYIAKKGLDPDGVLMSLANYPTCKGHRDCIRKEINRIGDNDLLQWYNVTTEAWDSYRDLEKVKSEFLVTLLNSKGTIKLLQLQLEEESKGLIPFDAATMQYTEGYENWILSNYDIVVAG